MAAQRSEHLLTAGSGGMAVCQRRGTRSDGAQSVKPRPPAAGFLLLTEPLETDQGSINFISTRTGATSMRSFCRSAARATRAGSLRKALRF